jgi:hypothetical protein
MLTRVTKPFVLIAVFVLVVGMACSLFGGDTSTPAPEPQQPIEQPPAEVPTQAPPPTQEPPTAEPQPAASEFYVEDFDFDPDWDLFYTSGNEDKATVTFEDGLMIFKLEDTSIYAYYMNPNFEYRDVTVSIRAENRGKNNNNVSLVCRYSEEGWYEFSTEGGGLWYLYAATPRADGKFEYNRIDNGGAMMLKQGKEVNEYSMTCSDNEIKLEINGESLKTIKENKYALRKGTVGFNISSLNVYPIIVEVDWFEVSEP